MRGSGIFVLVIGVSILVLFFYCITLLNAHLFARPGRSVMYREFYECGFRMVPDVRVSLDIQFALLCFIFLVYDIEVIILVPLVINLHSLPLLSYILL